MVPRKTQNHFKTAIISSLRVLLHGFHQVFQQFWQDKKEKDLIVWCDITLNKKSALWDLSAETYLVNLMTWWRLNWVGNIHFYALLVSVLFSFCMTDNTYVTLWYLNLLKKQVLVEELSTRSGIEISFWTGCSRCDLVNESKSENCRNHFSNWSQSLQLEGSIPEKIGLTTLW